MSNVILCGSKKYYNTNFDKLVDSFDIIYRHNWLANYHGYGKRLPTFQILNDHMYRNWVKKNYDSQAITEFYKSYGHDLNSIEKFKKYIDNCNKPVYYTNNNKALLNKFNIKKGFGIKPRCGIASVLECVNSGIKPFLIGYSIEKESFLEHCTNKIVNKKRDDLGHSATDEINLIKDFHKKGLIDASFCLIKDLKNDFILSTDSRIYPTNESIEILKEVYADRFV